MRDRNFDVEDPQTEQKSGRETKTSRCAKRLTAPLIFEEVVRACFACCGSESLNASGVVNPLAVSLCVCWSQRGATSGLRSMPMRSVRISSTRLNVFPIHLPSLRERVDDMSVANCWNLAKEHGSAAQSY